MRRLLFALTLTLFASVAAHAQVGYYVNAGPTLPARCNADATKGPVDVFVRRSSSVNTLYVCGDLNNAWKPAGSSTGVTSWNGRTGVVTLTSGDITTALGFTPLSPSNNLSDVANAGTARNNLGLGTAATKNVPASGDAASAEVVKGNDSRLSDARPSVVLVTVGTGDVAANSLVKYAADGTVIAVTGTEGILGVATSTASAGATASVRTVGAAACVAEGTIVAGNYLIAGTTDPTRCKDSGATLLSAVPISTRIVGKANAAASNGATFSVSLIGPYRFGAQVAESDVTNLTTDLAAKAPLASPVFTGQPTIPDFTNAPHSHQNAAGGGTLNASAIAAGTLPVVRGGSGVDGTALTTNRLLKYNTNFVNSLLSDDGTNTTLTAGALRGPDGTAAAPTFSFNNQTTTGWYYASGTINGTIGGTKYFAFNSAAFYAPSLHFDAVADDVRLERDAANTLALRNSTNAQTFRVYNTYTDASNYERASLFWSSNIFRLALESAGTGSARGLFIDAATFGFRTNGGTTRWSIDSSGHLVAGADNTYDIGASGATRPRTGYFGTSIEVASGGFRGASDGARVDSAAFLTWLSRSRIASPSDGVITLSNNAQTDFSRLQFGGTTASFPAWKRNGTFLEARLADDSATTRIIVSGIRSGTSSNTDLDGQLTLSSGTATYTFAGTYTSAPICIATNTSAASALQVAVTTTALTVTGSGTDVVNYICHGRN
jgi:hypothetical protein